MGLITASSINFDILPEYRVKGFYLYDEFETEICNIRDILVDEETRKPRYIIVEVGGLLSIKGKRTLIPWRMLIKRGMSRLDIQRSLEDVMMAPSPDDPDAPTRVEEGRVHSYFFIEPYWNVEEE